MITPNPRQSQEKSATSHSPTPRTSSRGHESADRYPSDWHTDIFGARVPYHGFMLPAGSGRGAHERDAGQSGAARGIDRCHERSLDDTAELLRRNGGDGIDQPLTFIWRKSANSDHRRVQRSDGFMVESDGPAD